MVRQVIIASLAGVLNVTSSITWAAEGTAAQVYSYSLKDESQFEEGYRRHLEWHAQQNDQLVWYAWTIDSGPRKGVFVDGTFGTTFSGLDARPNLAGDGADYRRNVAPFVTALDVEAWTLWPLPSTAQPLEHREPGASLDVFILRVDPANTLAFEAGLERLAKTKRNVSKLTWYRIVRGPELPSYVLLLTRNSLAEIETAGPTLLEMLTKAYASTPAQASEVLRYVHSVRSETWSYEPRLALIPGTPLAP